ncbi:Ankyrin repeat-containing protein [Theobroma cacao]|uniref:Ankyrin repeat-containing protein n=1 Tax=Theobroma cacao TaxID=3641 RepID=A0A061FN69_THECC|nr:Ankyrin repeat-containing protein [Theobroma cacao]
MDESLRSAALSGNIDALYALIEEDADVLRRIDEMEFVDTPLHIAAAAGHTEFARELMNLKPSFARKLNQSGSSPLHLALQNKQEKMVDDLLSIDKNLVRVKGREGYTPLHHAAREGNDSLLTKFLEKCPSSILDVTVRNETALHIAAKYNKLEALKAILEWLPISFHGSIINSEDKDGNTVLHIAASNNQTQMIKLLIQSKRVLKGKVNQSGSTALQVLEAQARDDSRESVNILKRAKVPAYIIIEKMFSPKIRGYIEIMTEIREMKTETVNTLLVVLSLILTMTYQAVLSPPIVVAKRIIILLVPLYVIMACCYSVAHAIIAPNPYVYFGASAVCGIILSFSIFYYLGVKANLIPFHAKGMEDGFLRDIDQMEFVDTPLHVAAAAGRAEFALELLDLKPSLATKLNQEGLGPMHLALQNEHAETVLSLLRFDKNLVRVEGKNGYTPFLYAVTKGDSPVMKGDRPVLNEFLKDCPQCFHDVTNRNETDLHVAVQNNSFEAFQVLKLWLWRLDCSVRQIKRILNFKNRDGDTALHIAASKNQPKIVRLLTDYGIMNMKATNWKNLTALGILQGQNQEDSGKCKEILLSANRAIFFGAIALIQLISQLKYNIKTMSGDKNNALLVVTVLILTATYQAALSPPGGVFQANSEPKNTTSQFQIPHSFHNISSSITNKIFKMDRSAAGSSVLHTAPFLFFFIPNIMAFGISFLQTCVVLISILPAVLSNALVLSLSMLVVCLLISSVRIISPNSLSVVVMYETVDLLVGLPVLVMFLTIFLRLVISLVISRLWRMAWKEN